MRKKTKKDTTIEMRFLNKKIIEINSRKLIKGLVIASLAFFIIFIANGVSCFFLTFLRTFMFPMVTLMMSYFIALIALYPTLSVEGRFFGGFLFLYIMYKVFSIFVYALIYLIKLIVQIWRKK
jgi:hypothetical protein